MSVRRLLDRHGVVRALLGRQPRAADVVLRHEAAQQGGVAGAVGARVARVAELQVEGERLGGLCHTRRTRSAVHRREGARCGSAPCAALSAAAAALAAGWVLGGRRRTSAPTGAPAAAAQRVCSIVRIASVDHVPVSVACMHM